MESILQVFAHEAREQIATMEDGLLRLEQGERDAETINAIFRAAHTIKGASGAIELPQIERFTHVLENVLDELRNGKIDVNGDLITAVLQGCDHIGRLIDRVEAGVVTPDAALEEAGNALGEALKRFVADSPVAAAPAQCVEPQAVEVERLDDDECDGTRGDCWHISIRFGRDVLRNGVEPLSFLRFLTSLGEIVQLTTVLDAMPAAAEMDAEACYLGFEIGLCSDASKQQIENVFQFCRDECTLYILAPHSSVGEYLKVIESLPEESMRLGEILVKSGALTQEELDQALKAQAAAAQPSAGASPPQQIGQILVGRNVVHPELVAAAADKQKQVAEKKTQEMRLIRVQADKLDQLIDLVGELVIAGASVHLLAQKSDQGALMEATSVLTRLVENIRDSALQLRMVQIGETFSRFNRVVRDTAREMGKAIDLVITGAETELDKSVVEKLSDPLMHLVRNAIDHGIEPTVVRTERGKPEIGTVRLNAFHDSGSIVIEVGDDGGGLSKERIRAKAFDKGLIDAAAVLSDQEVIDLIFAPGFSTAEQVSNISGRGVGMDVVRRNIESLRGSIDVQSSEGQGSTFTIRLPLTLAIIDGFLTSVANASYVIPLDMVIECIELKDVPTDRNYLNLRGGVLPFVRMRELFEVEGEPPARQNVVIVQYGGRKAGLVVDALHGELQTVIKPLAAMFKHLRGIGGSTILGSGEVALILDVQALISRCMRGEEQLVYGNAAARPSEVH